MAVGIFIKGNEIIAMSHVNLDVGFGSTRMINQSDKVVYLTDDEAMKLSRQLFNAVQRPFGGPLATSINTDIIKSRDPEDVTIMYDQRQHKYVKVTNENRDRVPRTNQDFNPHRLII